MKSKLNLINRILVPHKYKFYLSLKNEEFNYLDIGCGPNSPFKTKIIFPKCNYYGADLDKDRIAKAELDLMEDFYHVNLNESDISEIPDDFFSVINISHVIEHLEIGIEVLNKLIPKLKKGGILYVEFPSVKSLSFPSKKGTLHFCDDPTHIYLPSLRETANLLLKNKMTIIKGGTRRDKARIFLFPVYYIVDKFIYRHGTAGSFWDLRGFAKFIAAVK